MPAWLISRCWDIEIIIPNWLLTYFGFSLGLYTFLTLCVTIDQRFARRNKVSFELSFDRELWPWTDIVVHDLETCTVMATYVWPNCYYQASERETQEWEESSIYPTSEGGSHRTPENITDPGSHFRTFTESKPSEEPGTPTSSALSLLPANRPRNVSPGPSMPSRHLTPPSLNWEVQEILLRIREGTSLGKYPWDLGALSVSYINLRDLDRHQNPQFYPNFFNQPISKSPE